MTTAPVQNAPKLSRISGTEIGALVLITVFTIAIVALGWKIAANTVKASAYHRALPCASGASIASDCISYQTMRVASKDTVELENLPDLCYLDLQDATTPRLRVEVDNGLYSAVSVGATVSVKFWRGKAMIVIGGGTRSGTDNHPDRENHHAWLFIVIIGLADWLFVLGYLAERRKRIRNSVPDVTWPATPLTPTRFQQWEVKEDAEELTMIRQPKNSPILCFCLGGTAIVLTVYWIFYFALHPAELVAYSWIVFIIEITLIALTFSTWRSNRLETEAFQRGKTPRVRFLRGGTSVVSNHEALGTAKRILLEEQTTGEEKGQQSLKIIVENGQTLYLGWVYPDDMANIRPFAMHLAAFLDLPLEFTKEEKPGSD